MVEVLSSTPTPVHVFDYKICDLYLNVQLTNFVEKYCTRSFFVDETIAEEDDRNSENNWSGRTNSERVIKYSRLVLR